MMDSDIRHKNNAKSMSDTDISVSCNGMCMTGDEYGMPEYALYVDPHPSCPRHGILDREFEGQWERVFGAN